MLGDCMKNELIEIKKQIMQDSENVNKTKQGIEPLFSVDPQSKIIIIGQAPGVRAEKTQLTWNDPSGDKLREWLGVGREDFYNTKIFGQMPMDFYYPGKAKTGDLPPRKNFAGKWHPRILACVENVRLIILVGSYSQAYYLNNKESLTTRVKNYNKYLPQFFVLPHPSPINIRWQKTNPWFSSDVVPQLRKIVAQIIKHSK